MNAAVSEVFHGEASIEIQRLDLVEAKGRIWGWQWRRTFGDKVSVSVKSLMGRVQAEQHSTMEGGTFDRHYPEVFLGDALEFAVALKHIHERHRSMALVHYVVVQPAKVKAHEMGIAIQTYWQRRNSMRRALADVMNV
jgi:hypothetical protein